MPPSPDRTDRSSSARVDRALRPLREPRARRAFARDPRWLLAAALLGAVAACTPSIGDKCVLSTDCSTRGDRLCDTSQPDGYCTQFNCSKNGCPDEAACVLFNAAVPGCGYDDRSGRYGSRVARSFCAASCASDDDCRGGYVCADPRLAPWSGIILDDDQGKRTCLVVSVDMNGDGGAMVSSGGIDSAPVCRPVAPDAGAVDASPARVTEAGAKPPPLVGDAGAADAADAGDGGDGG